jgi:hypothetical protein
MHPAFCAVVDVGAGLAGEECGCALHGGYTYGIEDNKKPGRTGLYHLT